MTLRRALVLVAVGVVVMAAVLAAVLHLRPAQDRVWALVTDRIAESTGLEVTADRFALRLLPARLTLENLEVAAGERTLARARGLTAAWRWRSVVGSPPRVESVRIENLEVDTDALPELPPADAGGGEPGRLVHAFEVGELAIVNASVQGTLPVTSFRLLGLGLDASLRGGRARADVRADRATLTRNGRELSLGSVRATGFGGADGVRIEQLELTGGAIKARATGEAELEPLRGRIDVEVAGELAEAVAWWDPNLAAGYRPQGLVDLVGSASIDSEAGFELDLVHRGGELLVADLPVAELGAAVGGGGPALSAAHPSWGRLRARLVGDATLEIAAELDRAPAHTALAMLQPRLLELVGEPALLSGSLEAAIAYPVDPDSLSATADLALASPNARLEVVAEGAGRTWRVERFEAAAAGATARGFGRLEGDRIRTEIEVDVPSPARVAGEIRPWLPQLGPLGIGGGPIELRVSVAGRTTNPALVVDADWTEPAVAGRRLERITATALGSFDRVEWEVMADLAPGSNLIASGATRVADLETTGRWEIETADLAAVAEIEARLIEIGASGSLSGNGRFAYGAAGVTASGEVEGEGLVVAGLDVDSLSLRFAVDPDAAAVEELGLRALGGEILGAVRVDRGAVAPTVDGSLTWSDLDPGRLPWEVPKVAAGRLTGTLRIAGELAAPEGQVEVVWVSSGESPVAERVELEAILENGVVSLMTREAETAFGPLVVSAEIPLAVFELPGGMWPEAESAPVRGSVTGRGLSSARAAEVFDLPWLQSVIEADLEADLEWRPDRPVGPSIVVEATGLWLTSPTGRLVAEGPLLVMFDDGALQVEPFVIVGPATRIEGEAIYLPGEDRVDARLRARLGEAIARWVPLDIKMSGPLDVEAEISGPADLATFGERVRGSFRIEHDGGSLVWNDPPLQIQDLNMDGLIDKHGLTIDDGSATVNRGRVELAGGWDPASEQGVVAEINGVTVFVEGVLTRWNGNLAVEPRRGRLAHIVGDLAMVAGLWDETFSITENVFGPGAAAPDVDDPLRDVTLELKIRDRSGIRVNNNLGTFNTSWDVLYVGGTAAEPILEGEVKIESGGTINIGGHRMAVRRGGVEFTGDPTIDPIVEIVPMTETTLMGGDGEQIDATVLATRGLAQGLSSVLGFENETLQPAEIATQIDRDPSQQFMVGQRLTGNLALFFGTNLTDVQDRTTMLQAWNIRGLTGLIVQAYQETIDDNSGANAIQRFQWGGSDADDDRPTIARMRLEGDWPVSKRRLKKATKLRRGHPFDPFLLFVASVRMERELAEAGYQRARVAAEQEGREDSPKLVFTCEPGPRQAVEFTGISLPAHLRRTVTALYRPPPLQQTAFDNMRGEVERHLDGKGFPKAVVTVSRHDEIVVVDAVPGPRLRLEGPVFEGLSVEGVVALQDMLGAQQTLALAYDQPERLARAAERLLAAEGWPDAEVRNVVLRRSSESALEVVLEIEAGPRATVDRVELVGGDPLGLVDDESFAVRVGMPLDRSLIDSGVRRLRQAYLEAGYRDVSARSVVDRHGDGSWAVRIRLEPGAVRTVREVRLEGTRGLQDRLLRRGITLEPGDVLTDAEIERSASEIANFSPVERVEVRVIERGTSQADVELDVIQKRRWTAYAGGGWSTERGAQGSFGFRDDNLLGRGVSADLRGNWDSTERRIFVIGSLPPAPGSSWALISTIGWSSGDAPDEPELLEQEELLASFEARYALTPSTSVGTYYRWTDTRTLEKEPDPFFPLDITVKVGELGLRSVTSRYDNIFDPRSGWGMTSDLAWSSDAVGSDLEYLRWLSSFGIARAPRPDWTWMQTVRVGVAEPLKGTNLDRDSRYFAGGQGSIRGFDRNSVGPTTLGIDFSLVPAGGGALFILNEELRIPVWGKLRAAVFADVGQVWESWGDADFDLSVGAGIGIRWSTPIGPLWADVAWPVANVGVSSDRPKFYLGIGRPF